MKQLISQNIVSRGFFVGTLCAVFWAATFLVPSPAFAVTPNQNPVKVFSDDFESGTFSKWLECGNQITTSLIHSGTRAFHYVRGGPCAAFLSQSTREAYLKFWWYLPSAFNFAPAPGKHFWRVTYGDTSQYQKEQIDTQTAGNGVMDVVYLFGGKEKAFFGAATLPAGRWFKYEFYTRLNDPGVANGEAKIWVDGVPQLNQNNVNVNATSNNLNMLELTTNYDNCTGTCDWYMDDVEVWNGCPSGSSCKAGSVSLPAPGNLTVVPPP